MSGVRYDGNVTTAASNVPNGAQAPIFTVPYAIVTVYLNTTPASLYSDSGLTQPLLNPLQADAEGRFGFWIASGIYTYTVTTATGVVVSNLPLSLNSPPGPAGPAGTVTAAGVTGGFNVPGQLTSGTNADGSANAYVLPSGAWPTNIEYDRQETLNEQYGGSWSLGNLGYWNVFKSQFIHQISAARGIKQAFSLQHDSRAIGDSAAIYAYLYTDGNPSALSDEGATAITAQSIENYGYFHGTVTSTTGSGDTAPVLAVSSGNNWTTDGCMLLNISKGTLAGNLNGVSTQFQTGNLGQFPVTGVTLPLTTAWGSLTSSGVVNNGHTTDVGASFTFNVTLGAIGAAHPAFTAGGVVWFVGNTYAEQAPITAVGAASGGVQSVTVTLRYPQGAGTLYVFQGGIQGQYMSFDANLAFSGMRSTYFAFGSLTGTDLIYGRSTGGFILASLPLSGSEAAQSSGAGSGFHLYPGAEVVKNQSLTANPVLEPNRVPWASGDVVENPHPTIFVGNAAFFPKTQYTPSDLSLGSAVIAMPVGGQGIGNGFKWFSVQNNNPYSYYQSTGGPLMAPPIMRVNGPTGPWIDAERPSDYTNPLFLIRGLEAGVTQYQVFSMPYFRLTVDVTNQRAVFAYPINVPSIQIGGATSFSGTITTAKLTTGGTNGSMTFTSGVLTGMTAAT